jgi:hypothetical protein
VPFRKFGLNRFSFSCTRTKSILSGFDCHMFPSQLYNILVFGFLCARISGWGRDGHFITSRLAYALLDKGGQDLITDLLADGISPIEALLCDASVWADHVSDSRQYRWSKSLHYINIPDGVCDGFSFSRDCASNCTVSAIVRFAEIVEDITSTRSERIDSLRFLIHFIADLHQPLHVSFGRDRGGSLLKVVPPTILKRDRHGNPVSNISLHSAWDTDIIQYIFYKRSIDWKRLADEMVAKAYNSTFSIGFDELTTLATIANNSASLTCSAAYVHETGAWIQTGDSLSTDYYENAAKIVYGQLFNAGVHISQVLNAIGNAIYSDPGFDDSLDDSGYEAAESETDF